MIPTDFGYEDEFAFFEAASTEPSVYNSYRDWIKNLVVSEQIKTVILREGVADAERDALVAAAMKPYDEAFQKYRRRDESSPVDYPFSEYFAWWARQYAMASLRNTLI